MKYRILPFLFLALLGCKKKVQEMEYVIEGRLLESSSNPQPVKNYRLNFYQRDYGGFLGGLPGIFDSVKTDANGNFLFRYIPGKGTLLQSLGVNSDDITIYGANTATGPIHFEPVWRPVKSLTNVNLGTMYQYKKIQVLIRKVRFLNNLNAGDSLRVISTNGSASDQKTLNGPIAGGTVFMDTISNCRLNFYHLDNKTYSLLFTLSKPQYQKDTSYIMNNGDESLRVIEIDY